MMSLLEYWPTRLAIFLVAFSIFFAFRFGIVRAVLLSIPTSIALVYAVGFYRRATIVQRDLHLVERAANLAPPRDGEVVAVCGTIEPLGETLRSPVYNEISLAYHYKFDRELVSGRGSSRPTRNYRVDYAGYAAVPAVVRSQNITVRMAGFPILHGFGKIDDGTRPSLESFKRYLAGATFEQPPGKGLEFLGFADMDWDGRGKFSKDFRRAEGVDPAGSEFYERRVHPGSSVCAIGAWSESQKALVRGETQDVLLYPGTQEQVRQILASGINRLTRRAFIIGAVTLLIAIVLLLAFKQRSASTT